MIAPPDFFRHRNPRHAKPDRKPFFQFKNFFCGKARSRNGKPLRIRAGWRCETGAHRRRNEDRCAADADQGLFLVADGVGGNRGGAEASEILVKVLPDRLSQALHGAWRDADLIDSAIRDAIEAARREMIELAASDSDFHKMSATMVLALIAERTLHLTRVGDCRAYRLRDQKLQRLTTDQTFVQAGLDAGLLTEVVACAHPWRHVVTNTVGVKPMQEPLAIDEFELAAGDRLLLCSDGLTDAIDEAELQMLLALRHHPQATSDALIDFALGNDAHDNVTCVVVDMVE